MALACAGAVPKLSMTVVAVTPNAMPSAPSMSCASIPTPKYSHHVESTDPPPSALFPEGGSIHLIANSGASSLYSAERGRAFGLLPWHKYQEGLTSRDL